MTNAEGGKRRLLGLDPWIGFVASRLGGSVRVDVVGRTLDVGLTALPQAVMRPLLMYVITGTIGTEAAQLSMSPRLVDTLIQSVLPDARVAALRGETRALALEAALAPLIDDLEARLGADIQFKSVLDGSDAAAVVAPNCGVRLVIDGAAPLLVPASLPEAVIRKLLAFQAGVDGKDPALDPDVSLAVRIGRCLSTASEIASLTENDIVVLDDTLLDDNRVCLVVDDQLAVLGELDGKTLKLDGPLGPMDQWFLQRFASAGERGRRGGPPTNGAEPQVPLVADLAYRMAPVSELLRIDPKDPVPLPQAIDGIVELRANRKRVATGRLARVGNAVGVRILRVEQHVRS